MAFVTLNGLEQWVAVHGDDGEKPLLLVLHGGPGGAMDHLHAQLFTNWERAFTVVHWDQRGAGQTFKSHGQATGPLSIDLMTRDGIALAEHLRHQFNGRSLIALGISWGSLLGMEMVRRRPDLFDLYIGCGQVIDMQRGEQLSWRTAIDKARALGRRKAADRVEAEPPGPDRSLKALVRQRRLLFAAMPPVEQRFFKSVFWLTLKAVWPDVMDGLRHLRGSRYTVERLWPELMNWKIAGGGLDLAVPLAIVQGAEDMQTPTPLVVETFQALNAPAKSLTLIEGAGHAVFATHPEQMLAAMKTAAASLRPPSNSKAVA